MDTTRRGFLGWLGMGAAALVAGCDRIGQAQLKVHRHGTPPPAPAIQPKDNTLASFVRGGKEVMRLKPAGRWQLLGRDGLWKDVA